MHFGPYSLLLLLLALNGVGLAGLLWRRRVNRAANRRLAMLVALIALRLVPYILGYAGAYDAHRWLTFAPFDVSFAFGPLLWGYLVALTTGRAPDHWRRHLLPAAVQCAYGLACFALPLGAKWRWYTGPHLHVVEPAGAVLAVLLLAGYLAAAWRRLRAYQHWLYAEFSNVEPWRLDWLQLLLRAAGATLAVGVGYVLTDWLVTPLDYFQRLPLMAVLGGLAYVLGALGWRYGEIVYPVPRAAATAAVADVGAAAIGAIASGDAAPDLAPAAALASPPPEALEGYGALAASWAARTEAAEWYRDDGLSLASLAARLGTSPRTLSRVLNDGLGVSFHQFVNRMRVEAMAARLRDPAERDDLMRIAFDTGFNSKASFNRAFRSVMGVTPRQYRVGHREDPTPEPSAQESDPGEGHVVAPT